MFPAEDRTIVSVNAVPRYSIDEKLVKHIKFSVQSIRSMDAYAVLAIIADLRELEDIVQNVNLSAKDAQEHLKDIMLEKIKFFGKD